MDIEEKELVTRKMLYDRCFEDGKHCSGCNHNMETVEHYDIGDHVETEIVFTCNVTDYLDCPYYDAYLNDDETILEIDE